MTHCAIYKFQLQIFVPLIMKCYRDTNKHCSYKLKSWLSKFCEFLTSHCYIGFYFHTCLVVDYIVAQCQSCQPSSLGRGGVYHIAQTHVYTYLYRYMYVCTMFDDEAHSSDVFDLILVYCSIYYI